MKTLSRLLLFFGCAFSLLAEEAKQNETAEPSAEDIKLFKELKKKSYSKDHKKAVDAIKEILKMDKVFAEKVPAILEFRLRYNYNAIFNLIGKLKPYNAAQEEALAKLQKEAIDNIAVLKKDSSAIKKAFDYHKQLIDQSAKLTPLMKARLSAIIAIQRHLNERDSLLKGYRQIVETEHALVIKASKIIDDKIKAGFGVSYEDVKSFTPPSIGDSASGPLKAVWLYAFNRDVENYNKTLQSKVDSSEFGNLVLTNNYREVLGRKRLELDLRLVNSARAHTNEMIAKNYFSHDSPVKVNRTFKMRMAKAGYPKPGGENIAHGYPNASAVFKAWFESPGHHQSKVRSVFTALGVGKKNKHWTQNFGRGPRMMYNKSN